MASKHCFFQALQHSISWAPQHLFTVRPRYSPLHQDSTTILQLGPATLFYTRTLQHSFSWAPQHSFTLKTLHSAHKWINLDQKNVFLFSASPSINIIFLIYMIQISFIHCVLLKVHINTCTFCEEYKFYYYKLLLLDFHKKTRLIKKIRDHLISFKYNLILLMLKEFRRGIN